MEAGHLILSQEKIELFIILSSAVNQHLKIFYKPV
jgi:hypothetical protein